MNLIVGLGNPGRKYEGTRHNIGFEVVNELARRYATSRPKVKFHGEVCEAAVGGKNALLLQPHTFMNRSGGSVLAARDFYKIEHGDILIICDDFNLALARLRFRPKGSAGGQNGLADILRRLGTQDVPRLRFGIGAAPPEWDVADYVLSKFRQEEMDGLRKAIGRAADSVADWVRLGIAECMNKYNADPKTRPKQANKKAETNQAKDKKAEPIGRSPNLPSEGIKDGIKEP